MSLFLIIYTATGAVGGAIGPLPYGMEECLAQRGVIMQHAAYALEHHPGPDRVKDEFSRITFSCEYRTERPALGSEGLRQ